MPSWLDELVTKTSKIIYAQWASLGANVTVGPTRNAVVDPEALVVATCAFGRYDARIFDEGLDWLILNHRLLKPWRLKRIARLLSPEVQRTLGAVLDFVRREEGRDLFPGVIEESRQALGMVGEESLFFNEARLFETASRTPDPVFAGWKLLRGEPRTRRHSEVPDTTNGANLMIRLRKYYGTGAKGDVVTYLLTAGAGSGRRIARRLFYNQGSVYPVLEDLVDAAVVEKQGGRGSALYWIKDPRAIARSLGIEEEFPVFFVWGEAFRALYRVAEELRAQTDSSAGSFLEKERSRELIAKVVTELRDSGGPLAGLTMPDIGVENLPGALEQVIFEALDTLDKFST
jgi:hypothetical protein